jgi:hypothetical protein
MVLGFYFIFKIQPFWKGRGIFGEWERGITIAPKLILQKEMLDL